MVTKQTVLVLGAGASKRYGYPTGAELRDLIISGTEKGRELHTLLAEMMHHKDHDIRTFREHFDDANLPTIDEFLEQNPQYDLIGRQAIVGVLKPKEIHRELNRRASKRWYDYLFDVLRSDIDNFTEQKLQIITFNYDRSLEQFLGHSLLRAGYGLSSDDVRKCLQHLEFIHPYGTLGGRPYLDPSYLEYQDSDHYPYIKKAVDGIKTIRQDDEVEEAFKRPRELLDNAERIILLGFGFEKQNVGRLRLADCDCVNKAQVFATAKGISKGDWDRIREYFPFPSSPDHSVNGDCMELFDRWPLQ